jgi:ribonuclease HII
MAKKLLLEWPNHDLTCGLDEVGLGCGAGPVVTAAVILPIGFNHDLIRDSKKLSEKQRNEAYEIIINNALTYSCHAGSVKEINEIGINPSTFNTMHKCIDGLSIKPNHLLIDGSVWDDYKGTNTNNAKYDLVPKGDNTYTCIAAASIIAKVRRDEYMCKLSELYPNYNWCKNKGYLTPDHIDAIKNHGVNKYHRTLYVRNFVKKD